MATARSGRDAATISPLAAIHMSAHERRQAEQDLRTAEHLVSFIFDVVEGTQALVRRLRGHRVAR